MPKQEPKPYSEQTHEDLIRLCEQQAEEIDRLSLKASMFDSLLNFLPEHIYFKDEKSRFIAIGRSMREWFGAKSVNEVIGKTDFDLFSQEHAQTAFNDEQTILQSGKPISGKKEKETWGDGRVTWVSTNKAPLHNQFGRVIGTFGVSRDITQQHESDERLKEATRTIWDERNLLQTVIDLVPDAIYVKDEHHRFVLSNRSHYKMHGFEDEAAILGEKEDKFYDTETAQRIETEENEVLQNDGAIFNQEETRNHPLTNRVIHLATSKVTLKNHKINGLVCVSRDISAAHTALENLNFAKNEAEKANLAKSEFLAKMSHEIRTPLNGILGLTDWLLDSSLNAEQRVNLTTVKESARHQLQLINDLFDFSSIESGVITLNYQKFTLRTLIEDVMDIVFFDCEKEDLEIISIIDDDLPSKIIGDPGRLRQILINLLNNARKFTHYGYIALRVSKQSLDHSEIHAIQFSVEDTGIGIKKEKIDKIFNCFSQADNTITRPYGGTGLGLAISQKLALLMGGEIKVSSPPRNNHYRKFSSTGCVFYFQMQLRSPTISEVNDLDESFDDSINALAEKKVLIVGCSELTIESLSVLLKPQGIKTLIAYNDTQATSLIAQHEIDLLITDKFYAKNNLSQNIQSFLSNRRKAAIVLSQQGLEASGESLSVGYPYKQVNRPIRKRFLISAVSEIFNKTHNSDASQPVFHSTDSPFEKLKHRETTTHVLLVEDNPVNQQVAVALLEKVGMRIDIAENGLIALDKARKHTFDIILMDLQMPVMDGLTSTRELRKIRNYKDTPIIALTAQALREDKDNCEKAGMNDHISKPIRAQHFYKLLLHWLTIKK